MTSLPQMEEARMKVLELFEKNVLGKIPEVSKYDKGHDGKVGNWLEEQLGVKPNASNAPDLKGIEVKTSTKSVISLGSWDPNYWIFRDDKYGLTRDSFMITFG